MLFKTFVVSAIALVFANGAMGAALIATDPTAACNCPNNCDHHAGSSCKYYAGPSDSSQVISGTCVNEGSFITCVGQ